MANPTADYPTTIHTPSDISGFGNSDLGATTPTQLDLEGKQEQELTAIENKIGVGDSNPSEGRLLVGQSDGSTSWEKVGDVLSPFVKAVKGQFILKGQQFKMVGGNYYQLIRDGQSRSNITPLLDAAKNAGITVIRTYLDPSARLRSLVYPLGPVNLFGSNPSFETDTTDWILNADGGYADAFTRSNEDAHDGTWSIKQVSAFNTYQQIRRLFTVTANTDYTLTFWNKIQVIVGDGSHLVPAVEIQNSSGANFQVNGLTASASWQQTQIKFNSGARTSIYVTIVNQGAQTVCFYDQFDVSVSQPPSGLAYNESALKVVDMVLDETRKRGMKLILSLVDGTTNNTLNMGWYIGISNSLYGTSYSNNFPYLDFFTSTHIKDMYKDLIATLAVRVNTINGLVYKNDPTIFSWEEGNELMYKDPNHTNVNAINDSSIVLLSDANGWADTMAQYIHSQDPNHMVGFGDMGHSWKYASIGQDQDVVFNGGYYGVSYEVMALLDSFDYGDVHIYPNQSNGGGFGFNAGGGDIRGWGYGLGFSFITTLHPSAAGFWGQIKDWIDVFHANDKPCLIGETGVVTDGFTPTGDLVLYNRYNYFSNLFSHFYDSYGGDGVFPWALTPGTTSSSYDIALGATGGEALTDNSNDTTIINLFRKYGNKFNSDLLKTEGGISVGSQILATSGAIPIDPTIGQILKQTPVGATTFNASSISLAGAILSFVITTSGTSSYTLTFGTGFKSTGTLATGTVSGKVFTVTFRSDGVNWNETSRTTAM